MLETQVKQELAKHNLSWIAFSKWMNGQTVTIDDKGRTLYFEDDVNRYIAMKVKGRPTYFD